MTARCVSCFFCLAGPGFNHPQCLTTDRNATSLTWDTLQSTIRPPSRSKGRRSTIWRSTIDAPIFPPFRTHLKHCHHIRFKIKWDEGVDEKSYMEKRSLPLRAKIKIWIYMTYALWLRCDKGWVDSDNYKFFPRVAACPLCIMSCQVALPRSHRAANQRDIQRETSPCKNFPTLLIPGQIQSHIFLNQNYKVVFVWCVVFSGKEGHSLTDTTKTALGEYITERTTSSSEARSIWQ